MNLTKAVTHKPGSLVLLVMTVQAGLLIRGAMLHSPGWDEPAHLVAGLSHWETGRFELYRVNPPLTRLVASAPLTLLGIASGSSAFNNAPWVRPEFELGAKFVDRYGINSMNIFFISRCCCIMFPLIGSIVCYKWASDIYGRKSGLFSLLCWAFCPTILANGQMITPDVASASLCLATCYFFRRWLQSGCLFSAVLSGVVFGFALLTKFTICFLFFVFPVSWLIHASLFSTTSTKVLKSFFHLLLVFLIAVSLLNTFFMYKGSLRSLGSFQFVSLRLGGFGDDPFSTDYFGNKFSHTYLSNLPVPLPEDYIQGIDIQLRDFEKRYESYLRGVWRNEGWLHYYVYAVSIKEPLGILCIAALAVMSLIIYHPRHIILDECYLLLPAVTVFLLVSTQTGFNHHLRYVLPAYPFFFIFASRLLSRPSLAPRLFQWAAACSLFWSVTVVLCHDPNFLSYFNELVGGGSQGYKHLVHSNFDWGQDLYIFYRWAVEHPQVRPIQVIYSGSFSPEAMFDWPVDITFVSAPTSTYQNGATLSRPRFTAIFTNCFAYPFTITDLFAKFRDSAPYCVVADTIRIFKSD